MLHFKIGSETTFFLKQNNTSTTKTDFPESTELIRTLTLKHILLHWRLQLIEISNVR